VAAAIYVLAVGVRLVFLQEARHNPLYQCPTIDERFHDTTARAIADGTAPATAYFRAPAHLYFLAAIYKLTGPDSLRARYVQVFVAGLAPVLLFLIGGRLFGPAVGVLSGLLGAVFWTLVFFSTELLDVSLACVLYLLLAYVLIRADDGRWWKWPVSGGLMGLGAITRPNILAFAPVLAVVVVWVARKRIRSGSSGGAHGPPLWTGVSRVAQLAAGCMLAIAPVTLRNIVVAGEPVLIAAWGSGAFWASNNPDTDAKQMLRPSLDTSDSPLLPELQQNPWLRSAELSQSLIIYAAEHLGHKPSYREGEAFYTRLAMKYIWQYPGKFSSDLFKRFCYTFNAFEFPFNKDLYDFLGFSRFLTALSWLHFGVICPVGVLGLLLAIGRRIRPAGLVYYVAMLLTFVLSGTLFPVISRYRLPIVYLLMPLVAYGAVELVRRFVPPIRWRRVWRPVGVLAGLAVFCNVNVFGLRPAHCEYLLFHFIGACVAVERPDLIAKTSDKIEAILSDPAQAHHVPSKGMLPMFEYCHDRRDFARAARYGWEMVRRQERAPPRTLDALVKVFLHLGQRTQARHTLDLLERDTAGQPNLYLAQALARYGHACSDRAAFVRGAEQYAALSRRHPEEDRYRSGLSAVKRRLARLDGPPSSGPSASRPGP